jgi:hypothetical protein
MTAAGTADDRSGFRHAGRDTEREHRRCGRGRGSSCPAVHVEIADEAVADLRRIAAWRAPEREPVDDQSQGVQLAAVRDLASYWTTEYDWRACQAKLNALPQFITGIDGLDVHFHRQGDHQREEAPK